MLYRLLSNMMYSRVLNFTDKALINIDFVYREPYFYFILEDNMVVESSSCTPLPEHDNLPEIINMLHKAAQCNIMATQSVILDTNNIPTGNLLEIRFEVNTGITHRLQTTY
jgi:hypothetical protein